MKPGLGVGQTGFGHHLQPFHTLPTRKKSPQQHLPFSWSIALYDTKKRRWCNVNRQRSPDFDSVDEDPDTTYSLSTLNPSFTIFALEKGAIKAHRLTIALRAKGYEAYQFHDRKQSIVTVGSFSRPEQVSEEGRVVYSPDVQELLQRFGAKRQGTSPELRHPGLQTGILPETLLGIPFDIQPVLISVPQRSVSSDFAQRTLRTP